MTTLAGSQAMRLPEPVGVLHAWESDTSYPDETPFVSEVTWASRTGAHPEQGWLRGITVADMTPVINALPIAGFATGMGRVWVPWGFVPAVGSVGISTVGWGAVGSGAAWMAGGSTATIATTGLSSGHALSLMNRGQFTATMTPFWNEANEIRLLVPGLQPRTWRLREVLWEPLEYHGGDARRAEAIAEVNDLMRWLNRSQQEVADICRFSLRASRYWGGAKPKNPRLGTVRRLHEVHAFVGALVRAVGRERARDWLDQPSTAGGLRLDVLAAEDGVTSLVREASRFLFAEPPRPERTRPERTDALEAAALAEPYEPSPARGAARRPRMAPRRGE